ncbi:MAG: class I SAM-dependent methyltransferase [Deltaproteobacteria bacterium]|nr:class I SAM-dependent methyltransferase [Deltaproteobacteria bacterium]
MARNFRQELAELKCWDRESQSLADRHGEALEDAAMQNREELIGLCEFIEARRVRSYLEIGVWTGRLISTLDAIFEFDLIAACDQGYAREFDLPIRLPQRAHFFEGDSESAGFKRWRSELGQVDFVLIDANHAHHAVRRDFEINREFPHRFLAFHDITGATRQTAGVGRFWRELDFGHKLEIVRPHVELGFDHSIMGIGIWSETEALESQ